MSDLQTEDSHGLPGASQSPTLENSPPPKGWVQAIKSLRERLIDTSKRNRLIHSPIGNNRGKHLDIIEERSDEVFKLLVHEKKKMQFVHSGDGYDEPEIMEGIFIPDPDPPNPKHVDLKLQTRLNRDALHKRLLQLYRDSNSSIEEQGANPLFLALGFVRWYESSSSRIERFAPLVLLPVELIREGVKDNFRLLLRDHDLEPNHSFDAFLKGDFDIKLPPWPEGEEWLPSDYFREVNYLVTGRENWNVYADTIQLGFYSSGKFLMSKDLDMAEPTELMQQLLCGGFGDAPPLFDPDENLDDRYVNPQDLGHIMEADASQTRVIAAARDGRNMVVQGPPGTGKSQTIANIIAVSVRDDQNVLFVAEKRAALEVVHDRLEACGLGPLCLEMHSTKAQKKAIYHDLGETLKLGPPRMGDRSQYERLKAVRDELNTLSEQLHTVDEVSGQTPYRIIGQLTKLMADPDLPRPNYHVEETATWDPNTDKAARREVERLAELTREYGKEGTHDWRGANRKMTPMDRDRLGDQVKNLQIHLHELKSCLDQACTALSIHAERGLTFVDKVLRLLQSMEAKPADVDRLVDREDVIRHSTKLQQLFESIQKEQTIRVELEASVTPVAFDRDWSIEQCEISKREKSFFRWLSGSYRNAIKEIKKVAKDLPKPISDRLKLLNELIHHHSQIQEIDEQQALGELVTGPLWRGWKTDVTAALESVRWMNEQIELLGSSVTFKKQIKNWPEAAKPEELADMLSDRVHMFEEKWEEVVQMCDLDVQQAFGEESIRIVPLAVIMTRVSLWQKNPEGQDVWIRLCDSANAVSERGLDELRSRLADGRLAPKHACDTYDYIRAESLYKQFEKMNPNLSHMSGRERSALVGEFMDLDATPLNLSAQEVMSAHYSSIPEGTRGKMGVLRGEAKKKSRHMPLRRLLKEVGDAVQKIKPVFLMSPLSVAQYLDPGGLKFDLLIIDEASQVRPADAIGAVMRAKRTIIVGDQKQLPPTTFFEKLVNIDDEEEEQGLEDVIASQIGDMESILALCEARGMPGCMLKWHYRSQHESLIEVSNQEFYENKLVCPPSPAISSADLGLTFEYVGGTYYRGSGKSNNPKEAETLMKAVLEHARECPNESLGVVAMSQSQQTTIQNEAERMRALYPELNSFCSESKENPFFVKNLETVQGDERDVIFISIGYGRSEDGRLFQNFGPVSNEGGERRLNVLFTRAKKHCRVFSSIRHTDIKHDQARHRGPYMLKTFLKYAETGEMDIPIITGRPPDSPFEEAVADAIRGYGYDVDYQVGSEGFLIDLAVRDPNREGTYILAIECDGARYHSSHWARERDRMRQMLLEGKGWTFHRIWSTDWFANPETETKRAVEAIRHAHVKTPRISSYSQSQPTVVREAKPSQPPRPTQEYYNEFDNISYTSRAHYHHISDAGVGEVTDLITEIVDVEGPVHQEILVRKTREAWGYDHTGKLIKEKINKAIRVAVSQGLIERCEPDSGFLKKLGSEVHVRDRSKLKNPLLKKPEMISPQEYRKAILYAVERCLGIGTEECAVEVARMFGFKSTSGALKKHVLSQVTSLIREGYLTAQPDGTLRLTND
ncbi:MAG: DUF3320 domain-containing protein [Bacteroidota bacterium]|nr:DUF3320 domain-containing protein [Bacteroidota bacterium]MDE2644833.1 DUF3320 domain-containing protein [Bacteroidota bacterium]MXW32746.1 DUF3320 domain-containing protein [Rhodothermaceae bacterium]MYE64115.1 DUF3320 domain-containing protein [Rhodothermaceae bacterium]MYJ20922.1 DUF3320 domain-containing protein [Rhodothermaceae bacterium]